MRLCFCANEGHVSKTMDSVYNTHLNFRSCFSGKKCVLYTGKYGNHSQMSLQRQHFLLSYLKTPSVGPTGVELPHDSSVLNPHINLRCQFVCSPYTPSYKYENISCENFVKLQDQW